MAFLIRLGSIFPENFRKNVGNLLVYSGVKFGAEQFIGFYFLLILAISSLAAVIAQFVFNFSAPIIFAITFVVVLGAIYYSINSAIDKKSKLVETFLPDALQLVSSNIKAGLTTERALFVSARPEFGILSDQLKGASKKIMSGMSLTEALNDIPTKIRSETLKRTIWLIVQGIRSGGQIADLLVNLGNDLRDENAIKEEIAANVGMYVKMIFIAAAFGAPMLFGISSIIVGTISEQTSEISLPENLPKGSGSGIPLEAIIGKPAYVVGPEFVIMFTELALILTAVFSAVTIGVISTGKESSGFRSIPVILFIGFVLFFAIRGFLSGMLTGMLGGL